MVKRYKKHIINFKDLGNAAVYVATIYTNQGTINIILEIVRLN